MVDIDAVTGLLREAADRAILPRFRQLRQEDIVEKTPGELVTSADRETEDLLAEALPALLPSSRLVGEEGCSAEPALIGSIGQGLVWLLDPLDGTANFAAGKAPFAVMLALLRNGGALASWMLDPLTGDLWVAEAGSGAWHNEEKLRSDQHAPPLETMRGALISHFMPAHMQERIRTRFAAAEMLPKLMCSGAEYPAIALGERDVSLFWRTLPWDHVPGALFLAEAGGRVCRFDGSVYCALSDREGLIVARNQGIAERMVEALAESRLQVKERERP